MDLYSDIDGGGTLQINNNFNAFQPLNYQYPQPSKFPESNLKLTKKRSKANEFEDQPEL